jgi:hypothetical protein
MGFPLPKNECVDEKRDFPSWHFDAVSPPMREALGAGKSLPFVQPGRANARRLIRALGMMKKIIALCLFVVSTVSAAEPSAPVSLSELPPDIRRALQDICGGCIFANSDAPWNPSDVMNNLPQRRLVSIEHVGTEWRIQYEHGGIALHSHTITFSTQPTVHVISTSSCIPSEKCREW